MHRLRRAAAIAVASLAVLILVPAAAQAQGAPLDYVALGDSYTSGSGAGSYTDYMCQRSRRAHPPLLAAELGASLTFVACGGATTGDVLEDQVQALDAETDLVTIGIGGNDIDWTSAIRACIAPLTDCFPAIEEAERKATQELPAKLDAVYTAIEERAPHAEVYVTGYPRLFAARNTCDALGTISIAEQQRMNVGADVLSSVIETAADAHGFTYVDVRDEFTGHEICSRQPWLHGFTLLDIPYHPKAAGHSGGYLPALLEAL
ncbi:SGNH/GDSL hydrolase family protein [Glycomyces sp. TRM65418]|uniref:SGNH/GDSL hydrolase family protein n=1 Tax=Glycomyces sp. TRM65418 TaxID=2867006 RepID=UPI001CE67299|nr:SGNH/GDSL hydrolase family protein [Glycomyces sp. TRM65418]MCC3761647.1 SGNH/GDSL hydrolase family protein [Glycomyces sp. TRM65418]QZD55741.1 SGNH/GDSL hydrolase family protein [Glycomyces sp. TRM65418]